MCVCVTVEQMQLWCRCVKLGVFVETFGSLLAMIAY